MSTSSLPRHATVIPACGHRHRGALVIGAGISGLTCALRLQRMGIDVAVLEADSRPGGVIMSERDGEHLIELGPNSVLLKPEFGALIEEAGLSEELIRTPMRDHPRYIFKRDHGLLEAPASLKLFLGTPLLSLGAKMRLLAEPFLLGLPKSEISVANFARHHMGREMFEMLIAPFISGVYAGDPERMSLQGALPRMDALVKRGRGSLTRGAIAKMWRERPTRGQRRRPPSSLCTFREGLARLPEALAERLGNAFHPRTRVMSVALQGQPESGNTVWRVIVRSSDGEQSVWTTDALIVATPAHVAADLLATSLPAAAQPLSAIPYTSITVVHLTVPLDSVTHPPRGFGFLVPRGHGLRILGTLWTSAVFPERAPEGHALMTVFIGGATDPEAVSLDDAALMDHIETDLRTAMGWDGRRTMERITRYPRALPEYLMGHVNLIARLERAADSADAPLGFVGNYLHGISVADCIRQGGELAERIGMRVGVPA